MTYETALGVYNYLGAETELVPWAAAIDNLAYLKEMFARTGGYGALKVSPCAYCEGDRPRV